MRLLCKLVLALSALPLLMGAAVYRWVDENGIVNYTQLKPEGVDAELVSADTGRRQADPQAGASRQSDAPARAPADAAADQNLTEEQQQLLADLQAAERARQEEIARVRESNCQEARDVLQRLTQRGRIRIVDDDGRERVMPEEERQRRIDEAQRGVAVNCASTASR